MLRTFRFAAAAALAFTLVAGSAKAAVFNLVPGPSDTNKTSSYTYSPVDGITLKATALQATPGTPWLRGYTGGLGVCNSNEQTGCGQPNHAVDSQGTGESIKFDFSSAVTISNIFIGYTNGTAGSFKISGTTYNYSSSGGLIAVAGLTNITTFTLEAVDRCVSSTCVDSYFKIQALNAPLPAALPLFGAALAGLGYLRRRRGTAVDA